MSGPPTTDRSKLRDNFRGPSGWASSFQVSGLVERKVNISPHFDPVGRLTYEQAWGWRSELDTASKTAPVNHRSGLYDYPKDGWWTGGPDGGPDLIYKPPAPTQASPPPARDAEILPARVTSVATMHTDMTGIAGFDRETVEVVKASLLKGVPNVQDSELRLYMMRCRAFKFDPAQGLMYAFRNDRGELYIEPTFHGLLAMAEGTGKFGGFVGQPEFTWIEPPETVKSGPSPPDGKRLLSCTIRVRRTDWPEPVVVTAYYAEVAQEHKFAWKRMPRHMLEVRTKSFALREAFPREVGGLYVHEEMEDAREDRGTPPVVPVSDAGNTYTPPPEHRQEAEPAPPKAPEGAGPAPGVRAQDAPTTGGQPTTPPSGGTPPQSEEDRLRDQIQFHLGRADAELKERAQAEFRDAMQQLGKPTLLACNEEELRWVLRRMTDALGG